MHPDHRTGPQFSIKDLLIATAIVSLGLCAVASIAKYDPLGHRSPLLVGLILYLWLASCAIVGAGLGFPFKAMRRGAIIGIVFGWAVLVAVLTFSP
jgi:hypothetical protein